MAAYTKFEAFSEAMVRGNHDFDSNTFKVALTNTVPVASTGSVLADITQITAANGYSSGGTASAVTLSRTGGTTKIFWADVVFTATGGSMATFQYPVFYNSTNLGLIGYADYGSGLTLSVGSTFTVRFDGTLGFAQFS